MCFFFGMAWTWSFQRKAKNPLKNLGKLPSQDYEKQDTSGFEKFASKPKE